MRVFISLLVLGILLHSSNSQTPKGEPIVLKPSIEQYHSLTSSAGLLVKYFQITIDEKIPNEDLVILARPVEDTSDPDIFISGSSKYPDSFSNADIICTSNGLDVCVVPEKNITSNSTFYVGIKCYTQCSFAIKATYSYEEFFILQEDPNSETLSATFNLDFPTNDAKVVKFYIPDNKKNYQRILTKAQQVHPNKINESFTIFMNEGNNPPTTSRYHLKGIEAWNSGQCILISDLSDLWTSTTFGNFSRSNVNYTMLVQAPMGSNLQIQVQAYNDNMKVKLHQNLQDMVYVNNKITYELTIDDSSTADSTFGDASLLLTLTAFSGNPDLYVNPDTLPSDLTKYRWKSNEEGKESLIITPKERKAAGATNKKFYITVFGKLTSTFSLWIGTSNAFNFLTFGVAQTGIIENEEIINYRMFIFGEEELNITTTLNTETGNPDLYLKMCLLNDSENDWRMARQERMKCLVTLDDITNRYSKNPTGAELFLFSDNVGGKDAISFRYDPEKCFRQNYDESRPFMVNKCMFVIAVHGNCNWQNESQFSLVVTHSQQHIILTEGTPLRNRANLGEIHYYKFTLVDEKDIENINFHITEISGRVTTYISKTNRYPNESDYTKMSYSHWGNLIFTLDELKNNTIKSLAGTYYISILAETAATFSILTSVKRKTTNEENYQKITLSEGIPQYYSFLYDPNEKHYFTFKTHFKDFSDVMIHLTPIRGDFRLYVLNKKMSDLSYPTKADFHFVLESYDSTLLIRNTSSFYSMRATYVILVEPITDITTSTHNLFEFVIQYSTSESMKTLSTHNPLRESVKNNSYSFYRCEAHKGDESIEISINVHTYNPFYKTMLQVFFSFQSSHPFPDESFNEFNTTIQNNIWILVENSDLTTNCPYLFQDNLNYSKQCVFYMAIRAFESDSPEIVYSVNTKRNFIKKPETVSFDILSDNAPKSLHYNAQQTVEPFHFLYKLEKNKRSLHISAFTSEYFYGSSFVLMANFHSLANMTKTNLKEYFPREEQNAVSFTADSSWHHSVSFTIYEDYFKTLECLQTNEGCGLFISVFLKNQSYHGFTYPKSNSSFTIQVTRKLISLSPGIPFKGFVVDNEIKYFRLPIDENSTTILISVTPLNDGDPDLVVNRGTSKEWPDLFRYDYGSKGTKADQITINHIADLKQDNNTYVIGVYGKKNCSFVLTATYGDFHLVNLYSGNLAGFSLKPKERIYFKYTNYYDDEDFRVIFSKEYGEILFAMTTLNETEDFIDKLPDFKQNNFYWSNLQSRDLDHLSIQKNSEHYCKNCTYLILLEAEKETSLTVLISGNNQTIYLQNAKSLKDFVLAKNNNSYISYFYDEVGKIIVNILVYQGKIQASLYNGVSFNSTTLFDRKTNEFSNNIRFEYEPKNSSYWYYTMVNVLIQGITSSNYTIEIHAEGKERKIRYGITEYGETIAFSKSNFTFYSNTPEENEQYYSLTLKTNYYSNNTNISSGGNKTYSNYSQSILANTSIRIYITNEKNETIDTYVYTSRSLDYIYARFKAVKGDYVISIDNTKNSEWFSYTLLLSFSGMDLIYNDMEYINYLNVGKSNYYQLMVENNGKVLVELFQCYGRNRLYVASTQNNILNHYPDLKSELETTSSNHPTYLYDTKNFNEIYIAVKSIEGGNIDIFSGNNNNTYKISRYLLRTHFLKSGQTPYEVFYTGNDGNIYFLKEGDILKFQLKTLTCEKDCKSAMKSSLKNSIEFYKYTIRFHYDPSYLEESMTCFQLYNGSTDNFYSSSNLENAIFEYFSKSPFESTSTDMSFTVNLKDQTYQKNTPYYAKVVAQVYIKENNGIQPYSFFYKTVEFYPDISHIFMQEGDSGSSGLFWILVIVFIALVGALVAAYVFFKKYKTTASQLNYEMQDVGKIARVDDSNINRKDYIGLIADNKA